MKKLLLVLTALSTIAACSAAAAPNAPAMAHVAPTLAAPADALAGAPPAPVVAAAAQQATAPEQISMSARPVCDIRATPTAHGVAIAAVMTAGAPISGDYELLITKSGPSGSSDVQQGGAFNAGRGERVTLGQTELGLNRGDRFHAVLTLTDTHGRVCRDELRS